MEKAFAALVQDCHEMLPDDTWYIALSMSGLLHKLKRQHCSDVWAILENGTQRAALVSTIDL